MPPLQIKLTYIDGLKEIVLDEVGKYPDIRILVAGDEEMYAEFVEDLRVVHTLRSVSRAHIVIQSEEFNPSYISRHKSIVGGIVDIVLNKSGDKFKTFKITCAGSDSKEVASIAEYVRQTFSLEESEEADLKIHIIKIGNIWEVGAQTTARPLSLRDYKVGNIKGGMNPTIAYAMNSLAGLDSAHSYLNVFSGSATLLIEAARLNPSLSLVGFDKDKKSVSLAIQNIKKAGLIRSIQLKAFDIFDAPDLGTFDVIASDLPFGMLVAKGEDLAKLYGRFVEYCEGALNPQGRLVVYTSEHEALKEALRHSKFKVTKTLKLRFLTSVNAYLYPQIFVCEFK